MARRTVALLALLLAALCLRGAAKSEATLHYLAPGQIDLTVLLPPPPDADSPEQRADEQAVATSVAQHAAAPSATPLEARRNVFFFQPSVGAGFTPSKAPLTAAFFGRIGSDVQRLVDLAKLYWGRPRPTGAPKARGSYPSGHAAFAAAAAIVLAQLVPCKRAAIFMQARAFAENRIVLGLHYPSDIAAGWTTGTLAAFAMMGNAAFQRDFSQARTELRGVCPA